MTEKPQLNHSTRNEDKNLSQNYGFSLFFSKFLFLYTPCTVPRLRTICLAGKCPAPQLLSGEPWAPAPQQQSKAQTQLHCPCCASPRCALKPAASTPGALCISSQSTLPSSQHFAHSLGIKSAVNKRVPSVIIWHVHKTPHGDSQISSPGDRAGLTIIICLQCEHRH